MYESHYGFRELPFTLLPDPEFLYLSRQHRTALDLLEYSLAGQAGFSVISGEVGSGKTTLVRCFLKRVDAGTRVGVITNTYGASEDLLRLVLLAFDLDYRGKGRVELYQGFVDFLIEQYAAGRRTVLIVDEAQTLDSGSLEELRMLSNVNVDKHQVLQIILTGQPELVDKLNRPELRQFAQRISVSFHLAPLTFEETRGYIRHRLTVAGGARDLFDEPACGAVYYFSRGVPRLINGLCDTALVYGFGEGKSGIDLDTILGVVGDKARGGLTVLGAGSEGLSKEQIVEKIAEMGAAGAKASGTPEPAPGSAVHRLEHAPRPHGTRPAAPSAPPLTALPLDRPPLRAPASERPAPETRKPADLASPQKARESASCRAEKLSRDAAPEQRAAKKEARATLNEGSGSKAQRRPLPLNAGREKTLSDERERDEKGRPSWYRRVLSFGVILFALGILGSSTNLTHRAGLAEFGNAERIMNPVDQERGSTRSVSLVEPNQQIPATDDAQRHPDRTPKTTAYEGAEALDRPAKSSGSAEAKSGSTIRHGGSKEMTSRRRPISLDDKVKQTDFASAGELNPKLNSLTAEVRSQSTFLGAPLSLATPSEIGETKVGPSKIAQAQQIKERPRALSSPRAAVPLAASPEDTRQSSSHISGAASRAGLLLEQFVMARGVADKKPVDITKSFSLANDRAYAFARINNGGAPTQLSFIWFHGNTEYATVKVRVGVSDAWRTWSSAELLPGDWRVQLVSEDSRVLGENTFSVR